LTGNYSDAVDTYFRCKKHRKAAEGGIVYAEYLFYVSIALTALFKTDKSKKKLYWKELLKNIKEIKRFSDNSPQNYRHKYLLIKAEQCRVNGETAGAAILYEKALESAVENQFINDEAIIHELAAEFYFENKMRAPAHMHLEKAVRCYKLWGVSIKEKALMEKYPIILKKNPTKKAKQNMPPAFDTLTLEKTTKLFTNEIVLDSLMEKMLKILIENAGAGRALFLLNRDGVWKVGAAATIEDKLKGYRYSDEKTFKERKKDKYPKSVVNFTIHSEKQVVLNNVSVTHMFSSDRYFINNTPGSILCHPFMSQGKLIGILYMENRLAKDVFTEKRLEMLKILSSYAAISVEKALLYQIVENQKLKLSEQVLEKSETIDDITEKLKAAEEENLNLMLKYGASKLDEKTKEDCVKNLKSLMKDKKLYPEKTNSFLKN